MSHGLDDQTPRPCEQVVANMCEPRSFAQAVWLYRMYSGLRPYKNDSFDKLFPTEMSWSSPSIWDASSQNFIHNALPVPIHSHNDENRRIPLFEALGSGCISIEADVHLVKGQLLVGHSSSSLHAERNLSDMYLSPLLRMIQEQNPASLSGGSLRGIYNQDPGQTVVLLIDQKSDGAGPIEELYRQLSPLRDHDYLTYWNGTDRIIRPLTIVSSGSTPFEEILALDSTHRDIFWDAALDKLTSPEDDFSVDPPQYRYNISNSYFASTRWADATLFLLPESRQWPSAQARDKAAPQVEQARSRGLLARYWETPSGPQNMRDLVWRILVVGLQVPIINMDDMNIVRDRATGWGMVQQGVRRGTI